MPDINIWEGIRNKGEQWWLLLIGSARHYECNVSGGDVDVSSAFPNCRQIYADVEGIAKIDYVDDSNGDVWTEVLTIGPAPRAIRNVSKVYQNYKPATPTTAQIYDSSGGTYIGIKLRR